MEASESLHLCHMGLSHSRGTLLGGPYCKGILLFGGHFFLSPPKFANSRNSKERRVRQQLRGVIRDLAMRLEAAMGWSVSSEVSQWAHVCVCMCTGMLDLLVLAESWQALRRGL